MVVVVSLFGPSPFAPFDCCYRLQQFMAGECPVLQHYLLPSLMEGQGEGLPFPTAKIQFCALGCQEGRSFWRRFNTSNAVGADQRVCPQHRINPRILGRHARLYLQFITRTSLTLSFRVFVRIIHCIVSGVRIRVLERASVRCIPYLVATSGGHT